MTTRERIAGSVTIALVAIVIAGTAQAATVTYLGGDSTTLADWRTTSVAKPAAFDPNGDNAYGNDGYWYSSAYGANNTTPAPSVLVPAYLSSLNYAGNFYWSSEYVKFDDPAEGIGTSVTDANNGVLYGNGTKFTFDVTADTKFVVTVLFGGGKPTDPVPTGITITQTAGGSATATTIDPPTTKQSYVFFEIDAAAGDSFKVDVALSGSTGIAGLGFESVPAPPPPTPGTLIYGK